MREIYTYSERLVEMEKEAEQKNFFAHTDPAQFDSYNARAWSSKEIPHEVEEEKLLEVY
ncbi:hypothetical protein [Polluticoccus soli]|uniref:hypothetical protein n=1 Tax=Polluticoccus soli TaxID=3034150 RepID=UPI0023E127D3|nr:hypothetical protein [Flavipsychrobacter sp. JY13-12]